MEQRINSLSNEVRDSVRDLEGGMSQLHQVVQDKHHAIFRSQGAFEDQTNAEIEKFENRLYLVEKAVRLLPSSDAPAASGPDRAVSSGADVNIRDLVARVDRLQGESDRRAEWATSAIDELHAEYRSFADRMLESRSDGGSLVADRPRDPDAPQDWREAIKEINWKVQDLTRRVYRQARNYDTVVEDVGAVNAQIVVSNANTQRLQQAVQDIRTRLVNLPSTAEQTQAVVRRELVFYRNMLDASMRRLGTVENDDAADMVQFVQQNPGGP